MTSKEIEALAREDHYVLQLVSLRQMWPNASLGCVLHKDFSAAGPFKGETVRCRTVKDLMQIDFVSNPKFLCIDDHWDALRPRS